MAALPTEAELLAVRSDLHDYADDLAEYQNQALAAVKRILEDKRDILWSQVYDTNNDEYFDNEDATGRNEDRIKHAINLMTVALVFRDYAVDATDAGKWWELARAYATDAEEVILSAKLDIDSDESGTIDEGEEGYTGQVFLRR